MISAWMKGLVIYLILSGLAMKLIPGKNYEKYISLYMGFIMVIMLAKPVLMLFSVRDSGVDRFMESIDNYLNFNPDNVYGSNKSMNYYELGMSETIRLDLLKAGYDLSEVSFVTDDNEKVLSVTLYLSGEFEEKDLKNYINEVYKINLESIHIVRR